MTLSLIAAVGLIGSQPMQEIRAADLISQARAVNVDQVVRLEDLPRADGSRSRVLLERFEVLAPGAKVVARGPRGSERTVIPDVVLFRGSVEGDPEATVFLSVADSAVQGFIRDGGALVEILSTGRPGEKVPRPLRAMRGTDLPIGEEPPSCAGALVNPDLIGSVQPAAVPTPQGPFGGTQCRQARIAVETDHEFTSALFGGDTIASASYALTLIGACSEIYREEVGTRLTISFLRLWETADDPWTGANTSEQLGQFVQYWRDHEVGVPRELAHMLSGRGLGGGVAYLSVVCSQDWGFALSANLGGSFPYPLIDHSSSNWDVMVTAHELGHNFGSPHTHDYVPPIDGCGTGDCALAGEGTIMSYCHLCPGGLGNIALTLHPTVAAHIVEYLNANECDISHSGDQAVDDIATIWPQTPVAIDVLLNDLAESCSTVTVTNFQAQSNGGGTVELVPAGGGWTRPRLTYTPPAGTPASDSFSYSITGGLTATVNISFRSLREPDAPGVIEPGLHTRYYEIAESSALPDFDALDPYLNGTEAVLSFPSTDGAFASSGRTDLVAAGFDGFLEAPFDGVYTLYLESDDGSRLLIGDQVVVSNDGLHGMVERAGVIGLKSGLHRVRVEFFENFGGAGLFARWSSPIIEKSVIPDGHWYHAPACPSDLDGDGQTGFQDLLDIIAAWGSCSVCPQDIDHSGTVGMPDLLIVLTEWGPC